MNPVNPVQYFWKDLDLENELKYATKEMVFFCGMQYLMNLLKILDSDPKEKRLKIYQDFVEYANEMKAENERRNREGEKSKGD